ncbi:hypothetical protein KGY72_05015 [Candidatus Bipolaricaulota bacterium]|nr:hypothetical protein [Candidatus Bipolaricaulota bacterium]
MEEVSTDFVVKWTQSPDQDLQVDNRGWPKGKLRKWNGKMRERIKRIREELEDDPEQFYIGPTAVQIEYHRRYPEEDLPPVRTIGKILSDLDMTNEQQKGKNKGAAEYLRYPEETIYEKIGNRVLEADFVGEKYITGRTEPINFIGYSFKQEPRLRHFKRVKGETTDEFINKTEKFFSRFEKPDVVKVDNAMAMIGGGRGKRALSRTMIFLLDYQVYPVYSVPRKPFTQASIEGNNSVFARKFWNRFEFGSVEEIDRRLESFNESSRKYTQYQPPDSSPINGDAFEPKVYFTRQVQQSDNGGKGEVGILNEVIELPTDYVKYFVLGEWRLKEEKLLVRFEKEEEGSTVIKSVDFPINERSKERCPDLLNG